MSEEIHSVGESPLRTVRRLLVPVLAAGTLLGTGPLLLPAAAAVPEQTVTVYLAAPDLPALDTLAAAAAKLPEQTRLARLAGLVPPPADGAAVAARLTKLGVTVTTRTTWSVEVRGRADRIRALFGSARATRPGAATAQSLPLLPAVLRGRVAVAVGGDETRPALHPLVVPAGTGYTGPQLRAAYRSAVPAAAPVPTVATLQLAGWDRRDLTRYAAAAGVADPIAGGRYHPVLLGRSETYDPAVDGTDNAEVALDQESILAAAPTAAQRPYFAPNTWSGYLSVLDRVGTDARLPGARLISFSTSWGSCESDWGSVLSAAEPMLAAAAAAGVTSFAATGDAGSGDCTGRLGVDYPASSPRVVGVGGTTLRQTTGGGWTETGWRESGGGCSVLFAKPSWQSATGSVCPGRRSLPDISSVGDPNTGLAVVVDGAWATYGGTSLSSPLAAALLANAWVGTGRITGYGDLHPALYAAPAGAFRDVIGGANGAYRATVGYDLVSGRGSPQWAVLRPLLGGGSTGPVQPPPPPPPPPPPTKPVHPHGG